MTKTSKLEEIYFTIFIRSGILFSEFLDKRKQNKYSFLQKKVLQLKYVLS